MFSHHAFKTHLIRQLFWEETPDPLPHSHSLLLCVSYHSELSLLQGSFHGPLYMCYQECKFIYLDVCLCHLKW